MALPELGFGNSCNISRSKEYVNTSNTFFFFPLQITTMIKLVSTALELNYGHFSCWYNQHVLLFSKIITLKVSYLNFAQQLQLFFVTS